MWSEIFFQNLSDSAKALFCGRSQYSTNDIEYALYEELKSEPYSKYIDSFIKEQDSRND
jgi:hypothetical protein